MIALRAVNRSLSATEEYYLTRVRYCYSVLHNRHALYSVYTTNPTERSTAAIERSMNESGLE